MYLVLNNLQWLICHKSKRNQINSLGPDIRISDGQSVINTFGSMPLANRLHCCPVDSLEEQPGVC